MLKFANSLYNYNNNKYSQYNIAYPEDEIKYRANS